MAAITNRDQQAHLTCPACAQKYTMGSHEYCPLDGERLQLQPAVAVSVSEPAKDPSLLGGLLNRMGLRKRSLVIPTDPDGGKATQPAIPTLPLAEHNNLLPSQVIEKGWGVTGTHMSNEIMDVWQVARHSTEAGSAYARYSQYRCQVLTSQALYAQLGAHSCAALPKLLDYGTTHLNGHARASFELTLAPDRASQSMASWLKQAPPSEEKALSLLPHLTAMLTNLAAAGVQSISFSPSQMLRHIDGHIALDNLAALTETASSPSDDYRPELNRTPFIGRLCSAPELAEQLVVSPKSALFSLGQVLAEALWGHPCAVADLRAGNVPFSTISDARLARILQGCLWVQTIVGRWDLAQLQAAVTAPLDAMPPVEDWAQLGPRAMGKAFALNGKTYWRVEDLLTQAVQPGNWTQAISRLGSLLDWIEGGSPWASAATHLRKQLDSGRSADYVLVQLAHTVVPHLPLTWRGLDFSDEHARDSLVGLAQRNLAPDTTAEDADLLEALFRADLRRGFVSATHSGE